MFGAESVFGEFSEYETQVAAIVGNSLTIDERVKAGIRPVRQWDQARRKMIMSAWQNACADGDEQRFKERLTWLGLDPQQAEAMLGDAGAVERKAWPDWAHALLGALERFHSDGNSIPLPDGSANDYPFGAILEGFAQYAMELLCPAYDDLSVLVDDRGLRMLDGEIRARLAMLACQALMAEFQTMRAPLLAGTISLPSSHAVYDRFVSGMHGRGMIDFLTTYPVLGRFIGTTIVHWAESIAEFRDRLLSDCQLLKTEFGINDGNRIVGLHLGISDLHNCGRSCVRLELADGQCIFYKPKSLKPDLVFYAAQARQAELLDKDPPLFPKTLDRGSYGWVEEVVGGPCKSDDEVRQFYAAAGRLLFLQYLVGGADLHHENLIASGIHPVVTDHECLMTNVPGVQAGSATVRKKLETELNLNSVMRVGMLPVWVGSVSGIKIDTSALGRIFGPQSNHSRLDVKFPNSDVMRLTRAAPVTSINANSVILYGAPVDPGDYLDDLVEGFTSAYRGCMSDPVLTPELHEQLCDLTVRHVFRSTHVYAAHSMRLKAPSSLRDGIAAQICLEGLYRGIVYEPSGGERLRGLVPGEIADLMRLDTPVLHARSRATDIITGDGNTIGAVFADSAETVLNRRISRLGEADLSQQKTLIATSFHCRADSGHSRAATGAMPGRVPDDLSHDQRSLNDDARALATTIARDILDNAVIGDDGSRNWISVAHRSHYGFWRITPMRERLYDGTVGTALFLAAFAKCGGGREYEDAAIGALAPLLDRKSLRNTVRTLKYPGLGIGGGIGSAIYGLVKIAGILDKVDLLDAAEHIADLIDDDDILNARHINLMQGTAGYMTACLSLQAVRPNSRRLRAIDLCGAHLLKRADCDPNSRRSWRDPAGTTRMGLAYGNSGIGLALARAGRILDRPAFAAAAQQAIAFAQGLQAETIAASHACGSGDQPESLCSWCDGAAGIALACLELTNPVSDEGANWSDDLAAQTGILMNGPVDMHLDHVCCGNLGRAASLRRLGIQFGKAEITNLAETIYSRAIRRAKQRGGFELGWGPGLSVPSFHQGSAGIGYELLRLSADPTLPDILSFN